MNQFQKHKGEEAYREKTVGKIQIKGKDHRSFKQNWRSQLLEDVFDDEEIEFFPTIDEQE